MRPTRTTLLGRLLSGVLGGTMTAALLVTVPPAATAAAPQEGHQPGVVGGVPDSHDHGTAAARPLAEPAAVPGIPSAAPPIPSRLPSQVDPPARYEPQVACDPRDKPGTRRLADLLLKTYGIGSGTSRGCTGSTSEHYDGRAVDWWPRQWIDSERRKADEFIAWALKTRDGVPFAMARRMGIMYIIWKGRLWASYTGGWREYQKCRTNPGAYDHNTCHRNHVHISLSWEGAMGNTSYWSGSIPKQQCPSGSQATAQPGSASRPSVLINPTGSPLPSRGRCRVGPRDSRGDGTLTTVVPVRSGSAVTQRIQVNRVRMNGLSSVRIWTSAGSSLRIGHDARLPVVRDLRLGSDGKIFARTAGGLSDLKVLGLGQIADRRVTVAAPTAVQTGRRMTFEGKVFGAPSGSVPALFVRTDGGWQRLQTGRIRDNKRYTINRDAPAPGRYKYRVGVVTDGRVLIWSARQLVTVRPRPENVTVTISWPRTLTAGVASRFSGSAKGAPGGSEIVLQASRPGDSWRRVAIAPVRRGSFTLTGAVPQSGAVRLRAGLRVDGEIVSWGKIAQRSVLMPVTGPAQIGRRITKDVRVEIGAVPDGATVQLRTHPVGERWIDGPRRPVESGSTQALPLRLSRTGDHKYAVVVRDSTGRIVKWTEKVALRVVRPADVRIRATNPESVQPGSDLRIRGRARYAPDGAEVVQQWRWAGEDQWRTVGTAPVSNVDYRFDLTTPVRDSGIISTRLGLRIGRSVISWTSTTTVHVPLPLQTAAKTGLGRQTSVTAQVGSVPGGAWARLQWRRLGGSWRTIDGARAVSGRSVVLQHEPASAGDARLRVLVRHAGRVIKRSAVSPVSVVRPDDVLVRLSVPTSARRGSQIEVSGIARYAPAGATVLVRTRESDGGWRNVGSTTVRDSYHWDLDAVVTAGRSQEFRAHLLVAGRIVSTSHPKRVWVR